MGVLGEAGQTLGPTGEEAHVGYGGTATAHVTDRKEGEFQGT